MARDDSTEANHWETAWAGLRSFFRAWRTLREQRYRYLEEILGDSAQPPAPTRCPCDHPL